MALDPNITGTDQDDYLVATPGTNVIDAGAGDDMIETVDGDNTILFDAGSGLDTLTFAPARSYQYAGFLEEAQTALAALTGVTGPVTDEYFGTLAPGVLINTLPSDISDVLRQFKPGRKRPGDSTPAALGTVDADLARQTMQSLIDWINAPTQDVIQFAPGITPANLTVQVLDSSGDNFGVPNQFQVSINGQDGLIFQLGRPDFVAAPTTGSSTPPPVPVMFSFADGTTMTLAELLSAPPTNHDPVASSLGDQNANEDAAFSFQIPADTFVDSDAGDVLTLSVNALNANGDPVALPAWLNFDAGTGTFSGTPTNADVGSVSVQVTATDMAGATASTTLSIGVANVNDAPVATLGGMSASATQDSAFTFAMPANVFSDVDSGDVLTLSASALDVNGNPVALPAWLKFDAATGSFSGTPANGDVGALSVQVTATDMAGAAASTMLNIGVANVNDAPVATVAGMSASATQDSAFTFAMPANVFSDVDSGDVLTLSASALDVNGNPVALPAWLKFDAATGSFSGTPANGDVGALSVQVTATDMAGATAFTMLNIGVANVNDAPVGVPTITGTLTKNQTLVADTIGISDADGLSTFSYQWLRDGVAIGGATAAAYTLGDADVGAKIGVQVGYVDGHGTSEMVASAPTGAVADINHAPQLMTPIADQSAVVGNAFNLTLPATVFR